MYSSDKCFPLGRQLKKFTKQRTESGLAINVIHVNSFGVETNNNYRQQCINVLALSIMRLNSHFLITFIHLGCILTRQFFFSLGLETFCCGSWLGVEVPEFISPDSDNSPCKGPK